MMCESIHPTHVFSSGKAYPFYPIQTMCEQADFCRKDSDVHRLGELHRSAEYHKDRYTASQYGFILEHLQYTLDEIQAEKKKKHAMKQFNDQ